MKQHIQGSNPARKGHAKEWRWKKAKKRRQERKVCGLLQFAHYGVEQVPAMQEWSRQESTIDIKEG